MSYMKQKDQLVCICGNDHFIKTPLVLLSNPPQIVYECTQCNETYAIPDDKIIEETNGVKVYY